MRSQARGWLLTVVCGLLMAAVVPAAAQAFEVEGFTAVNCKAGHSECAGAKTAGPFGEAPYWFPNEPTEAEAKAQGFVQAGGRVPYGVTDFKVKTSGTYPTAKPEGAP